MSRSALRLGTRSSRLAAVQASLIADALAAVGVEVSVVPITTSGDARAPDTAWGEGAFVDALEAALRAGRVDAAVHSAKDMPVQSDAAPDLMVAAYVSRADARDALVLRNGDTPTGIEAIAPALAVGTDSPRRTGFLLALRPDLRLRPLSGNVDTRLDRLDAGEVDALVLAVAGLERLGRADRIGMAFDPAHVPPAPGQGALAVQVRTDDSATRDRVARLDAGPVREAVETERALLAFLGAGCQSPIGAYASLDDQRMTLVAGRVEPGGRDSRISTWHGVRGSGMALAAEAAEALA